MKRKFHLLLAVGIFCTVTSFAQSYKTSAGLQIDFGDGSTLVGPNIKHFFDANSAIKGEVLFGNSITFLQAFYNYQKSIPGSKGLDWYIGGGPSLGLYSGGSSFYLRPMVGLDYKFGGIPFAMSFDWRPFIYLGNAGGSRFTAARFGINFNYVIN